MVIVAVIAVVMLVGFLVGATIFRASAYSDLMTVQNSDFDRDFSDISYDEVPRIDASRAKTLADQQLGSLSQYKPAICGCIQVGQQYQKRLARIYSH